MPLQISRRPLMEKCFAGLGDVEGGGGGRGGEEIEESCIRFAGSARSWEKPSRVELNLMGIEDVGERRAF